MEATEKETKKLNIDSSGRTIITHQDKRYDAQHLAGAIAKSPKAELDSKIKFHTDHFDQEQFPEEWKTKIQIPAMILFEGKYLIVYMPPNYVGRTFAKFILVSSFNLKKAKYLSPQEREEIEKEAKQAADDNVPYERRSWGHKTTHSGFENRPRFLGTSDRPHSSKPRSNSRG